MTVTWLFLLALGTIFISSNQGLSAEALVSPASARYVLEFGPRHAHGISSVRPFSVHASTRKFSTTSIIDHATAASTIVIPTLAGLSIDSFFQRTRVRNLSKLRGIGALVTILSASIISGLGLCTSTHHIRELCWTRLLPASLSLWLVASTVEDESIDTSSQHGTLNEIVAVSIPFAIGCIGSILGCLLSFTCCCVSRHNASRVHKRILPGRQHFFMTPGHLLLSPAEAAVAAGCLCSSYIGGPWNYFASMRILANDESLPLFAKDAVRGVLGGTFGSSASDMLLMPFYFSILQTMISSKRISKLFPGRCADQRCTTIGTNEDDASGHKEYNDKIDSVSQKSIRLARFLIVALTVPTILAVVRLSEVIEARNDIVGIGIAINSVLSCAIPAIFLQLLRLSGKQQRSTMPMLVAEIRSITTKLSDSCYYMLLSVIGASTNRVEIFAGGWAPSSSFVFSSTSLFSHLIIIVFGTLGLMRCFPKCKQFPLRTEEIAVASCAAVVGPQAATALAVKSADQNSTSSISMNWKGLALSGTILGVLGYIISCPIGVMLSKCLIYSIEKHHWYGT